MLELRASNALMAEQPQLEGVRPRGLQQARWPSVRTPARTRGARRASLRRRHLFPRPSSHGSVTRVRSKAERHWVRQAAAIDGVCTHLCTAERGRLQSKAGSHQGSCV